ncbi:MAG TPA: WXG100 family type VII secretion target [Trebonia sp.]|jgi:WXG100 family type VII secretion target
MSMNDGDIYVNYSGVNDVEDALNDATQAVGKILGEIQSAVGPLTANWEGSSVDAYAQIQTKWNSDITDMQACLAKYAPTLDEMKLNYSNTDNSLALSWSQIK